MKDAAVAGAHDRACRFPVYGSPQSSRSRDVTPVPELKQVLCAIDFSEPSDRVVGYAAAFARWYEADLMVLHVAGALEREMAGLGPTRSGRTLVGPSHDQVADDLRRSIALLGAGAGALDAYVAVREGDPVTVILEEAAGVHADLLVLGTHGRSGFNRLSVGSVSEQLVRKASCPVLTVPPYATSVPSDAMLLKRILCPLDFSPSSKLSLQYALSLAREANGSLTVLHVIEWFPDEEPRVDAHFHVREYRQRLIQDAREQLHADIPEEVRARCDVKEAVTFSKAYREILSVAHAAPAELIVMGAQGRGAVDSLLIGSTTERVLREAPCPVLTVRAESPAGSTA